MEEDLLRADLDRFKKSSRQADQNGQDEPRLVFSRRVSCSGKHNSYESTSCSQSLTCSEWLAGGTEGWTRSDRLARRCQQGGGASPFTPFVCSYSLAGLTVTQVLIADLFFILAALAWFIAGLAEKSSVQTTVRGGNNLLCCWSKSTRSCSFMSGCCTAGAA